MSNSGPGLHIIFDFCGDSSAVMFHTYGFTIFFFEICPLSVLVHNAELLAVCAVFNWFIIFRLSYFALSLWYIRHSKILALSLYFIFPFVTYASLAGNPNCFVFSIYDVFCLMCDEAVFSARVRRKRYRKCSRVSFHLRNNRCDEHWGVQAG